MSTTMEDYPKLDLNIFVLIKQVPKAMKTTAEGLMDRSGKSQMNPHCTNALEEAIALKDKVGGKITIVSMGPPNAQQSINEALRKGADRGYLLSDRKLAGSDTWSTAEALATTIRHILKEHNETLDVLFGGLQTIDGDTAQVPAQVAARLRLNQVTYVDKVDIYDDKHLKIRRIIEGGHHLLKVPFPTMLSITETANKPRGPSLSASMAAVNKEIIIYNIDAVGLPQKHAGMEGSPTVVSRVRNVVIERDKVKKFNEENVAATVSLMLNAVNEEKTS